MTTASSPLAIPLYRALWIATVVSNIGTWMNDVGAGWLMTSLSPSPLLVALIQAATTLPMALLALPGGALADIFDRRRLMLIAQCWALVCACTLFAITLSGAVNAYLLLLLVFLTACASAVTAPTYQSLISEIVPRDAIPQAVALGGLGVNIARAIGPAIGGLLVAAAGPAWVFLLNGCTYVGTIFVLLRWHREAPVDHYPREHFLGAIRAAVRFLRGSEELRAVTVRAVTFFLFASATWSLLPVFARRSLGLNATEYGMMLGCIGLGAIGGAFLLPRVRARLAANGISVVAALTMAAATALLSVADSLATASAACLAIGIAWILMMATIQSAAQLNAPGWVKARALGLFLVAFQGSMALGAAIWGSIAVHIGVRPTILVAAGGIALFQLLAAVFRLSIDPSRDLGPSNHWPMPNLVRALDNDVGPVLVTIEYRVAEADLEAFIHALQRLRTIRRRDGATHWGFWQATDDPTLVMETFQAASWLEHLRQHDRVSQADRIVQEEIARMTIEGRTSARHWIAR